MTPFGEAMRSLRRRKGVSQKEMARAIGVSPAYLSALEHGHKGTPSFDFLQRVAGYFNIIWDEAEALFSLARSSDPRVVLDTSGLPPEYTAFANRLSARLRTLSPEDIARLEAILEKRA
ncbi:helix-turn-helix domain-containing protein [Gellertiella hungarica]|uniref:Transcriptional regulator with XRE-family HTH domain n=1 Tax=Gellertiella hungarica TaxID=1572859 RepID=A0A7W6NMQ5_9HYPH|nr:transcriptional regulator with XRE-family HTH domain [Gellertiella hungarica]